ncbi:hypothetical protein TIFTF001_016118 [Ficus carica]|uniref:Uncharacterized protein n=1 Tax=Ficus carica TaxID=3494 RepID=A0AA87ZZS0_FICCA|nr:hypothetical protein TIFTF001_016118 [Ficus carica]
MYNFYSTSPTVHPQPPFSIFSNPISLSLSLSLFFLSLSLAKQLKLASQSSRPSSSPVASSTTALKPSSTPTPFTPLLSPPPPPTHHHHLHHLHQTTRHFTTTLHNNLNPPHSPRQPLPLKASPSIASHSLTPPSIDLFETLGRRLVLDPGLEEARQNGRQPDVDLKTEGKGALGFSF